MKIINRLYFKIIIIAIILIVVIINFYYQDNNYQNRYTQQTKNLKEVQNNAEIKIKTLEKEIIYYKNKVKKLKEKKILSDANKFTNIIELKKQYNKEIKTQKDKLSEKYKKMIMYNIHHQVLDELNYAPYLPVIQLQEMMKKRFILEDMSYKIYIKENNLKPFDGIKFEDNKTQSIIRDSELLEVIFDTK